MALATGPATAQEDLWQYTQTIDKMRNSVELSANLNSNEHIQIGPRDAGPAIMSVARRGREKYVMLAMKGSFDCYYAAGEFMCDIEVKFDDKKIIKFSGREFHDAPYDFIILFEPEKFIQNMKGSSSAIIELPIYGVGRQQLTYSTTGFAPEKVGLR